MELWYTEYQTREFGITCKISETLYREKSKYQDIAVIETNQFGRMLVLDGTVQTTIRDEFIYHEMISHIPLLTHNNPRKVLVIGGGDGGTIREIIKHKSVEEAILVEIDKRVIEVSKEYFPELSCGLDADNVKVKVEDGINFVRNNKNKFDVILVDSTDPVGPAEGLFAVDFYKSIFESLKDDGIMVAQTESPYIHEKLIKKVNSDLSSIFPIVKLYTCPIPTYPGGYWSFTMASKKFNPEEKKIEKINFETEYLTEKLFNSCFDLPKFINKFLGTVKKKVD